jgi:hypothetical protein
VTAITQLRDLGQTALSELDATLRQRAGRISDSAIRRFGLAGAIGVQRVRHENAYAEEGQQGCYELGHRRLPWVMAMPTMAAVRKWR